MIIPLLLMISDMIYLLEPNKDNFDPQETSANEYRSKIFWWIRNTYTYILILIEKKKAGSMLANNLNPRTPDILELNLHTRWITLPPQTIFLKQNINFNFL